MIIEQLTDRVFVCSPVIEDWSIMYKTTELFRHYTEPVSIHITEYQYKQELLAIVRRNVEHLLSTEAIQRTIQLRVDQAPQPLQQAARPTTAIFVANFGQDYDITLVDREQQLNIGIKTNSAVFVRSADQVAVAYNATGLRKSVYIDWILTAE